MFRAISPANQIISNNDGRFNRSYGLDKDGLKAVFDLNN